MEASATLTETVASRLKAFLAEKQLNTNKASIKLGYGNSTKLHKILSGSQGPSLQTLAELSTTFPDLSLDWLVLGRAVGGQTTAPAIFIADGDKPHPLHAVTTGRVLVATVDRTGNDNIIHIPARAQAGYSHSFDEEQFIRDLTPYSLPMFTNGTFRSFEVEGDSMAPTFGHRDTVICQAVHRLDMLAPGHCYVIVVDGNVWVKRLPKAIKNRRDVVEMVSDNRAYPVHEINATDILEVWHVRAVLSTNIPASSREV
ncbi:MAG: S24 family peptidase [Hymenobacteraceae bacterium]|nr:S24 family peptidase [Hymenobacteraceae bacterium]